MNSHPDPGFTFFEFSKFEALSPARCWGRKGVDHRAQILASLTISLTHDIERKLCLSANGGLIRLGLRLARGRHDNMLADQLNAFVAVVAGGFGQATAEENGLFMTA